MCGISGFLNRDQERPADEALLRQMTDAIAHRGPDGSGHFLDGPAALGHRRLSIIDLSQNGAQPMQNEDGTVTVTFNGEIYNYLGLREELIARATSSAPAATPKSWSTVTRSGAISCRSAWAGCSPSPSGTRAGSACSSRATGSARSRSTTTSAATGSSSDPRSSRCSATT